MLGFQFTDSLILWSSILCSPFLVYSWDFSILVHGSYVVRPDGSGTAVLDIKISGVVVNFCSPLVKNLWPVYFPDLLYLSVYDGLQ